MHADYEIFNRSYEHIFKRLNLKPHVVQNQILHACGDIEGNSLSFHLSSLSCEPNFHIYNFFCHSLGHWGSVSHFSSNEAISIEYIGFSILIPFSTFNNKGR